MASFDVLIKPWIPVVDLSGGPPKEMGILEALERAHELREISDPSPLIRFGLYRILIAFIMDAFEIRRLEHIESLLNAGRFDPATLKRYTEEICDPSRFDLFDKDRPFLQAERNEELDGTEREMIARLFQHLPCGSFNTHFHHQRDDSHAVTPAVCARALAALPPFMTAGGAGYSPSINGAPPLYVLIAADSLFETLAMNCCAVPLPLDADGEKVSWRSLMPVHPKKQIRQFSLLHSYTWPCRRLRLLPSEGGICSYTGRSDDILVREMVYGPGLKAAGDWVDPQVAYKLTDKGRRKIEPDENREIWRDTGPLMLLREKDYAGEGGRVRFEQPIVVQQFRQLCQERVLPRNAELQLEVFGLVSDNMKLSEWRWERLSLPLSLILRSDAGQRVQQAIENAELVGFIIGKDIRKAFPREGKNTRNPFGLQISECKRVYWRELRTTFDSFLARLARMNENDLTGLDALNEYWQRDVRRVAESAFERVVDTLGSDALALTRHVRARDSLFSDLNKALPLTRAKKATKGKPKSKSPLRQKEVSTNV